ncbi:MAG: hypothetical protein QM703_22885 [Gemmatales bacterium]
MSVWQSWWYYIIRVGKQLVKWLKPTHETGETVTKIAVVVLPPLLSIYFSNYMILAVVYALIIGFVIGSTDRFMIVLGDKIVKAPDLYFGLAVSNLGTGKVLCQASVDKIVDQYGSSLFANLPSVVHWRNDDKSEFIPIGNVSKTAGVFITPLVENSGYFIEDGTRVNSIPFQVPKQHNVNIDAHIHPLRQLTKLYIHIIVEVDIDNNLVPIKQWYVMNRDTNLTLKEFANYAEKCGEPVFETPPAAKEFRVIDFTLVIPNMKTPFDLVPLDD